MFERLHLIFFLAFLSFCSCQDSAEDSHLQANSPFVVVLGIAQDAGYPQAGCYLSCCQQAWNDISQHRYVTSLLVVDPAIRKAWLIDATPDFKYQLQLIGKHAPSCALSGIFLTHAHIGHYTGLMNFGREVMHTKEMPVFAMPRMEDFLRNNGPWSLLVKLKNIELFSLQPDSTYVLSPALSIRPFLVPHRDEFSETVGFLITGPKRNLCFIPDIDKWDRWDTDIREVIRQTNYALLDGTFYDGDELPGRDMREIPHPFIVESLKLFEPLPDSLKSRVHFIHFNHTNPVLLENSAARRNVLSKGFRVAEQGTRLPL